MNRFLTLLLLFMHSGCAGAKGAAQVKTVYICGSGNGTRYHLTARCRGLSNCSYKTLETTLEKAKAQGKTRCKWEK